MDKNVVSFLILCVITIMCVFVVYSYNRKRYETQSVMAVVPIEDTSTTNIEYLVSNNDTTLQTISNAETTCSIKITTVPIVTTAIKKNTSNTSSLTTITETTTSTMVVTTESIETQVETEKVVNFPISLNSITYDELICINGIGDVTANKILDYRNSIGGYFISRYQLLEISGIGESKMNTIMEYTYIENEDFNYGQEPVAQDEAVVENPVDVQTYEQILYEETYQNVVEFPINLNTATLEELCAIPNMNETIAQEVLTLRDTIQYFSHPYELLYTKSISEQFLSEIIDYVYVE